MRGIFATLTLAFIAASGIAAALVIAKPIDPPARGPQAAVWTELGWPFPLDPWGRGEAFRCSASDCGTEVNLYLRIKTGFCNCTAGVADDDDLGRISDAELFGAELPPLSDGRAVVLAGMNGRARSHALASGQGLWVAALHAQCDAVVATAVVALDQLPAVEPAVMSFLEGRLARRGAVAALAR